MDLNYLNRRNFLRMSGGALVSANVPLYLGKPIGAVSAQSLPQIIQSYDPSTRLRGTDNFIISSLAAGNEKLEDITRLSFEDPSKQFVLGLVSSNGPDTFYINEYAQSLATRLNFSEIISYHIEGGRAPMFKVKPVRIKAAKIKEAKKTNTYILVWDNHTEVHLMQVFDTNTVTYVKNVTKRLENMLGYYPTDMISANLDAQNTGAEDDTVAFKWIDNLWAKYNLQQVVRLLVQPSEPINNIKPDGERFDLVRVFDPYPQVYPATNSDAFKFGNSVDSVITIRDTDYGFIDNLQAAAYLIDYNQAAKWHQEYRISGMITKWAEPVSIYVDPPVDFRGVYDAVKYGNLETGISFRFIDKETAKKEPCITFKVGPVNRGETTIRVVDQNGMAISADVLIDPLEASYAPGLNGWFLDRHELGHALGFIGHDTTGGLMSSSGSIDLSRPEINMMKYLQRLPFRTRLEYNGRLK